MRFEPRTDPRPGALRYTDDAGVVRWANPHDVFYSTVTMLATEYWDDEGERWLPIWAEPEPVPT